MNNNFINRDWNMSEKDDFEQNVAKRLGPTTEAVRVYFECEWNKDEAGDLAGWIIQGRYE